MMLVILIDDILTGFIYLFIYLFTSLLLYLCNRSWGHNKKVVIKDKQVKEGGVKTEEGYSHGLR